MAQDDNDSLKVNLENDDNLRFIQMEVPELLSSQLKNVSWDTFMDLGCGDGSLLLSLYQEGYFTDDSKSVYGVDLSPDRLERTKNVCPDIKTIVSDACDVKDISDGSIDFLVSTMVLEHVPDDSQMLREIERLLSDIGMAYITTVFKHPWSWYYYRANGQWVLDPTHCREYTDETEVISLLEELGFQINHNVKTGMWFPVTDFFFRRIKMAVIYENKFWRFFRKLKIPILGYKEWELVISRRNGDADKVK